MLSVLDLFMMILNLAWFVILAQAIMSWLISFGILDQRNQFVMQIWGILHSMTEPFYKPIRRFLPDMNGIDLTPLVALFAIFFLQSLTTRYLYPMVASAGL